MEKNSMKFGLALLISVIILAALGPLLSPYHYDSIELVMKNSPPSVDHLFGTDDLGRDIWTRVWMGARISLFVGVAAALIDLFIGTLWGSIAAIVGGKWEEWMIHTADVLYALPYLLLVTLLIVLMGPGLLTLVIAMSLTSWVMMARVARGQVKMLLQQEYVLASKALGASWTRILVYHLLPNAAAPLIVTLAITVRNAIFVEAFLSFLGLGIQAPIASWGTMASEGLSALQYYPWRAFFPGLMITLTLLSFQLIGDALATWITKERSA